MKKLYLKLLTCLGLLVSTPVLAEDSPIEFSANVGYFSDYIYRGCLLYTSDAADE